MSTKFSYSLQGFGDGTAHVRKPFRRVHDRSRAARPSHPHGVMAWHFRAIPSMASKRSPLKMAGRICPARRQLLLNTRTDADRPTRSQKAERIDDHRTHLHRQVVIDPDAWSDLAIGDLRQTSAQ
jgi:hypothetical protein